jgi:hypothetical protein
VSDRVDITGINESAESMEGKVIGLLVNIEFVIYISIVFAPPVTDSLAVSISVFKREGSSIIKKDAGLVTELDSKLVDLEGIGRLT